MPMVVSPPKYVSRAVHLMGGSIFFSLVTAPHLFGPETRAALEPKAYAALGVIVLFTGLFNAHSVQPKKMGAKAGFWRALVYGGKGLSLLACTPLGDKLFGEHSATAKLTGVVLAYLIGSYARYYREFHSKEEGSKLQTSQTSE